MSKTSDTSSRIKESVHKSQMGKIPCVLVYPDSKHVEYIYQITNYIEEVLRDLGFSIKKLSDVTKPDDHFGKTFEEIAEECVLGIVILDGFRPNVLFEYGYLKGKGKVVLPVQQKKACIAIKSLYALSGNQKEKEIKEKTGLSPLWFNRLIEPPIGYFSQLSDRHGTNVIEVDCYTELTSTEHPKNKIKKAVEQLMPKIREIYVKQIWRSF